MGNDLQEDLYELEEYIEAQRDLDMKMVQQMIKDECKALEDLLIYKNTRYGNSAIRPKRIFSKASPSEAVKVRIDDKLSRIEKTGITSSDEDTVSDMGGYLILLKILMKLEERHAKKETTKRKSRKPLRSNHTQASKRKRKTAS